MPITPCQKSRSIVFTALSYCFLKTYVTHWIYYVFFGLSHCPKKCGCFAGLVMRITVQATELLPANFCMSNDAIKAATDTTTPLLAMCHSMEGLALLWRGECHTVDGAAVVSKWARCEYGGGFGLGHPSPPDDNVYRVTHAILEFRNFPQHRSRFTDKKTHRQYDTPPGSKTAKKFFIKNKIGDGTNQDRKRSTNTMLTRWASGGIVTM